MVEAYLEIGALFEDTWTGIPNVVAAISEGALRDESINWHFVFDTIEIPREIVARFLAVRSGSGGLALVGRYAWEKRFVTPEAAKAAKGVYTNIKPMRDFFGKEAMVIYDLSPLLTPQFHNSDNIDHFSNRIGFDIASSDHLFCISRAVMTDVAAYFGRSFDDMSLIEMGIDIDYSHVSAAHLGLIGLQPEPYVVILGTLEPRKNGRIMLDYLLQDPSFASRYRIVFIGRDGWLDAKSRLLDTLSKAGIGRDRVIFTGYISEPDKIALLLNSAFTIYPSFFEGYGLPVLEASAFGKLTVSSNSSSIPEVSPADCVFFDPGNLEEFSRAIKKADLRAAQSRSWKQSLSDIKQRAAPLSWSRCYPGVAKWVHEAA